MASDREPDELESALPLLVAQSRSARSAIYRAKLRPAANAGHLLARPRLHALLDESVAAPLTLVVAPAGSGKTSLLRSWAADTRLPLAWLTLDVDDRDAVQLWRAVLASLEAIAPGCGAAAADQIRRPGGLVEGVGALLDDLERRPYDDRVLVIDDLEVVDAEPAVVESLALFVQHLPDWLHVVVASRHEPRLPMHRLRARGQLGEVHFAELRFSTEEAAALLGVLAPSLPAEQAADIAGRAGGWAASIQLAALAARSARARGGSLPTRADDRVYLQDYVWQEVLANERPEVVDALLATSVVEHIEVGLAQVLTGRRDAASLLAEAEARGLFVSRAEDSGTYAVHGLVREVLRSVLVDSDPDRHARLHGWAAGWHEAHGNTVSALEHWLLAGRPADARRLLAAESAALYDGGHEATIVRTVHALPVVTPAEGFDAMLEYAWCHLLVDRRRFVGLVAELTRLVRDDLDLSPTQGARLEVLGSIAATLGGHWWEGASLARSALETLGDNWWLDPLGQFAWNMIARDLALSERWDDAAPETQQVVRALGVAPERRAALDGTWALGRALAGRPADALALAGAAREASEVGDRTVLRTEVLAAEALAHRELGDLEAALPTLLELAEGRIEPAPHCQLLALLELTDARVGAGDLEAAERSFGVAVQLVETEMSGPGARTWLGRTAVGLALASGDLPSARAWAGQVVDDFWGGVVSARVHLAMEEPGLAADALKSATPRCARHRVVADLLAAQTAAVAGDADAYLAQAVRSAARLGLVQTVVAEGAAVVDAIERLPVAAPPAWLDRVRRAAPTGAAASGRPEGLVEELTDRELEVLRMLPSRLTLREIADELFISINTLKFHLKVVYRKLDCTSRAEAAEVARSLTSLRRSGSQTQPRH